MKRNKKYVKPLTEVSIFLSKYNICFDADPGITTSIQLGKANNLSNEDFDGDYDDFEPQLWDD